MSKPTKETFDYDKYYSLFDLSDLFRCEWEEIPQHSNGILEQTQEVQVTAEGVTAYEVPEFTKIKWTGGYIRFVLNGSLMLLTDRIFKIIPNELILNIEGI